MESTLRLYAIKDPSAIQTSVKSQKKKNISSLSWRAEDIDYHIEKGEEILNLDWLLSNYVIKKKFLLVSNGAQMSENKAPCMKFH